MDNKKLYNAGLASLKRALEELLQAKLDFASSSAETDDFPTTRHEIQEISDKIKLIESKLQSIYDSAYNNRFQ
jgi:hypothetical protein